MQWWCIHVGQACRAARLHDLLRRLIVLTVLLLLFKPASATDVWAVTTGIPCCGAVIPDDQYKYLDADTACQTEVPLPSDQPCLYVNSRNMRSQNGPQTQGGCVYDSTNVCGTPYTSSYGTNKYVWKKPRTCPAGFTLHLGRCEQDPPKACCDADLAYGNPANIASGNKYQAERIYGPGSGGLDVVLFYNSYQRNPYFQGGAFGRQWTTRYAARVRDTFQGIVAVGRGTGRELEFRQPASGNVYVADADINDRLERILDGAGALIGWRYTDSAADELEEYDSAGVLVSIRDRAGRTQTMAYSTTSTPPAIAPVAGLLIAVTDHFGRQLSFTYNAAKRVVGMTDPGGGVYSFEYDGASGPAGAGNLTKVTFPDGKSRVYFYGESAQINGGAACSTPASGLVNALTGLQDENGVRFATWTYNCESRITGSAHALGADGMVFTYGQDSRIVTDARGTQRTINIMPRILGVAYAADTTQPAASGTGNATKANTRDVQGNLSSRTDYNGNRTNYGYDLTRNLETSRTEGLDSSGATTAQTRTITTEWHATFRLPTQIAEPLRLTTNVYDANGTACGARGALCSRTIQATNDPNGAQGLSATPVGPPRVWTYTYNASGSVLTVNGPRTDVSDTTTYTYYANDDADPGKRGNVATVSNAAGHTTSINAYNAHGQPLTIIAPNGLTTTLTYDVRQRLKTRTTGSEQTSYDYDDAGQLTKVTLPDGSFLTYTYDAAHRLTGIQDNAGNRITYTLDAMGKRTAEEVFDPAGTLVQKRSRVYSSLNRLFQELGALNQTTEYGYDNQGNVTSIKDPLNRITTNQYDVLNRLKQVTDPALGVAQYAYNALDALTQVTDPRGLATGYTVDGLGNLTLQTSPDTGNTSSTYDAAGNLLTHTDAKGQVTTYAYDALNRVTLITFHDGSKQAYAYDSGTNGIGRLASITDTNAANQQTSLIQYSYTQHGRVSSESRTVGGVQYTVGYSYDSAGRLSSMSYPSGRTVSYAYDSVGRIGAINTTFSGQTRPVVASVAYHPFGGVKSYMLGNGQAYTRSYDQDGRVNSYTLGPKTFSIGYDVASRIEFISELGNPANSNTYGYDSLDRLTSALIPGTPYGYSYDAVGNRLSKTAGAGTETLNYGTTSNRIATLTPASGTARTFVVDSNGSTTNDGINTYAYDVRGRMVQAMSAVGATSYQVNALGQRIRKTNSQGDTVFHYDTAGRLIAETTPAGVRKREILYLGDIPVAVVQ